jgi:hypothetical protein
MRRFIILLTVVLVMATMLVVAGAASAQSCAGFGEHVTSEAKEFRPLGQTLKEFFGTGARSDLIHEEMGVFCEA